MLDWADRTGRFFENLLLALLLGGMTLLACTQIFLRETGFGSLLWGDEAVRLMVLWIAMVAGVAAAREDRHISIDVLSRFLPDRLQAFAAAIVALFTAALCFALAWYGNTMVQLAIEFEDILLVDMPAWIFQAIVPVSFFLMGWRYLIWFFRRVRTVFTGSAA
ncbi:MAG: TRAP transporter small permease [Gammaproteobacteria bacterium]|nr:TRAP transporter small permease [Gammaproteobacteria bacterium]NND53579.1 TRAP transporter small permease [Gammaproteobacteria bacterium]